MQEGQYTSKEIHEVETEIDNWKYRIERHKEYLQEMGELHKKLEEFDKSGKKNLLRYLHLLKCGIVMWAFRLPYIMSITAI